MKFQVKFKTPDALHDSICEAVDREIEDMPGVDATEKELIRSHRIETVAQSVSKWFRYGEYVVIELDTDAGTATVVAN